jgi:hypothetical protein
MPMTIDEIKELCREAKDRGDTEAFIERVRLLGVYHPDEYQAFLVELEKVANEPGGRLQ